MLVAQSVDMLQSKNVRVMASLLFQRRPLVLKYYKLKVDAAMTRNKVLGTQLISSPSLQSREVCILYDYMYR